MQVTIYIREINSTKVFTVIQRAQSNPKLEMLGFKVTLTPPINAMFESNPTFLFGRKRGPLNGNYVRVGLIFAGEIDILI